MLELRMANGNIARIRKTEIAAVNTLKNFDTELSTALCKAEVILKSGMVIGAEDTKGRIKAVIDAMAGF